MNEALQASLKDLTPQRVTEFQALDSAFHLGVADDLHEEEHIAGSRRTIETWLGR